MGERNQGNENIDHQYIVVDDRDKYLALKRFVDNTPDIFGVVFCRTKIDTQKIAEHLIKDGYNADALHGDLSQQQRDRVMKSFKNKTLQLLVATDVAARGIDVQDITHVIHYHLPDDIENYTHRSGRTARAGKEGISIALLHVREAYKLHQIERMAGVKFEKFMIPKGDEIIARRIKQFVHRFIDKQAELPIKLQNEWIYPLMQLNQQELVEKILAFELQQLDADYIQHADINVDETARRKEQRGSTGSGMHKGGHSSGTTRLWINLGKKDGIRYDDMRELIFKHTKISGHAVRDIQMQGVQSVFETDSAQAERILSSFKQVEYKGRAIRIWSEEKGSRSGSRPRIESPRTKRMEKPKHEGTVHQKSSRPRYKSRPADNTSW